MNTKIKNILKLVGTLLLAAVIVQGCSDVAGPNNSQVLSNSSIQSSNASKNQGITGDALDTNIEDGKQQGKIYVCKFVRTPNNKKGGGDWEVLKRGNQGLVHVSPNSERNNLPNFPEVNIGDSWTDAHTLSIVIDPQDGFDALADRHNEVAIAELCYGAGGGVIGGGGVD